ncbi:hypothetical protein CSUI_006557 [Cystoisospora suis]|uniref:Uncharacterized protein n=1 Tax=Cystoisospora suis TaxID=483139 RepID=A0A2C6KGJ6_9APIC|nr:hypothetical protein CSUI_006557 [Cystoisospora suis]
MHTPAGRASVSFLFPFISFKRNKLRQAFVLLPMMVRLLRHFFSAGPAVLSLLLGRRRRLPHTAAAGGYEDETKGGCQARNLGAQIRVGRDAQQYREKPKGRGDCSQKRLENKQMYFVVASKRSLSAFFGRQLTSHVREVSGAHVLRFSA